MIEIEHLSKNFGSLMAVDDLSLVIPRGEVFCFLGPNGAGKTTTLKLLAGLLKPRTGRIRIDGIDLQENAVAAKQRLGFIPDTPFLYERLTPEEYFRFTGELYGIPRSNVAAEMEQAFDLFGLTAYRHTLIRELSHGMRQRLVYASTFLHRPSVMLIDEPLVGLDPYSIRLIKDLLRAKAREGMTIFLTTHILALAEDVGDRIGILLQGRLRAVGTLPELLRLGGAPDLESVFLALTCGEPATHEG